MLDKACSRLCRSSQRKLHDVAAIAPIGEVAILASGLTAADEEEGQCPKQEAPWQEGPWQQDKGAEAAKAQDMAGARDSCKQCHQLYSDHYKKTMRDKPW